MSKRVEERMSKRVNEGITAGDERKSGRGNEGKTVEWLSGDTTGYGQSRLGGTSQAKGDRKCQKAKQKGWGKAAKRTCPPQQDHCEGWMGSKTS
jgi:hypothetical protein